MARLLGLLSGVIYGWVFGALGVITGLLVGWYLRQNFKNSVNKYSQQDKPAL